MKYKIYPLSYLANEELSENDIYYLFETPSLLYSILVEQFRTIGDDRKDSDIIKECKDNNDWIYDYQFKNYNKYKRFTNILKEAYKNIYQYSDKKSEDETILFMIKYGFSVKGSGKF